MKVKKKVILFFSIYLPLQIWTLKICNHDISKGSVSGSGTGPGDPGSRGPALPDPETFPYKWLGVRQYISMSCISCLQLVNISNPVVNT